MSERSISSYIDVLLRERFVEGDQMIQFVGRNMQQVADKQFLLILREGIASIETGKQFVIDDRFPDRQTQTLLKKSDSGIPERRSHEI